MSCFPCFSSKRSASRKEPPLTLDTEQDEHDNTQKNTNVPIESSNVPIQSSNAPSQTDVGNESNGVKTFTFRELATATKNFRPDYLLGEGGFGRVYKGSLENSGQTVAIKQLDKNGLNKDFVTEVKKLCLLHHQNLVNMIGYCTDGDQKLLVYEFIPSGSLDKHLLDLPSDQQPLSWQARIKIAYGAAQGLEYLHENTNPPVIYGDLKSSNILLDEDFTPKLSDFGLSRLGQMGELMGSYGYSRPEYTSSGQLSAKADVYSFGVLMLELITGRRVIDTTKPTHEQDLVSWATPMFKDQKRYLELVDPVLDGEFNLKELNQLVAVAAMCLQEESAVRPLMTDVVMTLNFLTTGSGPTTYSPDGGSSGD